MPSLRFFARTPAETNLYAELIRRGLPADYARRTADELDDHRDDLLADLRNTHADDPPVIARERLGETRKLAKRLARDYRRRSWFGRWPLLSFLLLPPLLLIAGWGAAALVLEGVGRLWMWSGGEPGTLWSPVEHARLAWLFALGLFGVLIPALLAWIVSRLALRRTCGASWVLVGCLAIGLLNSVPRHHYRVDPANPDLAMNLVTVSFCDPRDLGSVQACVRHLATKGSAGQLLAPLLMGLLVVLHDHRRRGALLAD